MWFVKRKIRSGAIKRKTNEVDIRGKFVIDGRGKSKINTGFKSLNHMLELFAFHGLFDLEINAKGDLEHHIVEDLGIALGDAFKNAISNAEGIKRYADVSAPMDEVLANIVLDVSGRALLKGTENIGAICAGVSDLDLGNDKLITFLESFVQHSKITVHIKLSCQGNSDAHHIFEAVFKAFGIALDKASQLDKRREGVSSTKGIID